MGRRRYSIGSIEGKDGDPIDPALAGDVVFIAVKIGYPGSRVTDILIGDQMVMVSNDQLRSAHELHYDLCDTEGG